MREHMAKRVREVACMGQLQMQLCLCGPIKIITSSTCNHLELRGVAAIAVVVRQHVFVAEPRLKHLTTSRHLIHTSTNQALNYTYMYAGKARRSKPQNRSANAHTHPCTHSAMHVRHMYPCEAQTCPGWRWVGYSKPLHDTSRSHNCSACACIMVHDSQWMLASMMTFGCEVTHFLH